MSQWPSIKAKRLLSALFGLGWKVKRQSALIARCPAKGGLMLSSRFTTAKKSVPECLRASPGTLALLQKTCSVSGVSNDAESGKGRLLTGPPHTTHHAGPQWAVQRGDARD